MKQCFGYVRVSTAKQGEGVSLEAQREAISAIAEHNDITITKWFEEKETAAKRGRPIFSSLIKALKLGQAQGLVVHKIDRSARNFADWGKIGDLADAGIAVHFATESLDFNSRGGRLSADIQAVIAADYIRNLREECIKGINGRLKQGLYPFNAPIGYVDNGGGKPKTIDPVRGPLVRQMFELYASGQQSINSLREEMPKRGLLSRGGKPLSKRGIETVLSNPFYCGLMRVKTTGAIYEGVHEPLISARLFETVQDVKAGKAGKKVTKHNHLFRGLFRCQRCAAAMTPELQKGYIYYRCHTKDCATKCVNQTAVDAAIRTMLAVNQISDEAFEMICAGMEKWQHDRRQDVGPSTTEMELGRISDRLDRLTDALIDRVIDQDTYTSKKEALLLEQARLRERLADERDQANEPERLRKFLERVKTLASYYETLEPAEKRQFINSTTSNRTVNGKNVVVEPSDWLAQTRDAVTGYCGDPHAPTSRTLEELAEIESKAIKSLEGRDGQSCK